VSFSCLLPGFLLCSPEGGFPEFFGCGFEKFSSRGALFESLHAVEQAAVFLVEFFEPVGIFLSGECFVLRDGEEDGAGFVVAGDGHGAVGGDFFKNIGGGVFEFGGRDGRHFGQTQRGDGRGVIGNAHPIRIANLIKMARSLRSGLRGRELILDFLNLKHQPEVIPKSERIWNSGMQRGRLACGAEVVRCQARRLTYMRGNLMGQELIIDIMFMTR
jgi:hypothetical protein